MSKLDYVLEGDRHVVFTRRFRASPEAVFRAHVEPELIRRWMLGPEGWTMPVCDNDVRPGGSFRYEWADADGNGFAITGEFVEVEAPSRLVHVERMHMPDPTLDNRIETTFAADGDGTLLTVRMTLPDEATRRAMLETGMAGGMEQSYARIDDVLDEG